MYAIVDIKGFQYKLSQGEKLRVPHFDSEVGATFTLDEVLLISDNGDVTIGEPVIEGAAVEATITEQGRYDKIVVFKKKRRKDYRLKRGHRQDFTEIEITGITLPGAKKKSKPAAKKKATPAPKKKAPAKAPVAKKTAKTPAKKKAE
jgi:large subunit ribosomal protein L21